MDAVFDLPESADMIRYAHPEYFVLLWSLPILAIIAWAEYRWRLKSMRNWADVELWENALPDRAPWRLLIRRWMGIAAIGFIILALTGPQVGTREVEVRREGTDIAIAMDLSQSMNAEDISPSRIVKARHEITRLLNKLHGDRVALVPFANVAFVQVPLTLDYSAVQTSLDALEPSIIPYPGTALAEAIKQARRAFSAESKAQKVILLITDSEDHDSNPVEQAKEAAKEGIKIFTVGMATPQGAPIPIKDRFGKISEYKEYKGSTVVSRLNESLLMEIATVTGGEYFRATRTGAEFRRIHDMITGMDTEEFEAKQFTDYEDRFQWPAAAAFLFLVLEELIPPGRRRRKW